MKQKILFVVPDGTGIRNYLFSDILPLLHKEGVEILVYHNLSDEAIHEIEKLHSITLNHKKIPAYKETLKQKLYREAICYARLRYNTRLVNNPTILTNWKTSYTGVKKAFYTLVETYGKYLSKDYKRILEAEKNYQKALKASISTEVSFLKQYQPTTVFCTHQRALTAIPIIKAANELQIKTIGAIYSWDNLPKARLSVQTQQYIVWSDYMKKELQLYYPEIPQKNILVTGTPQFELYNKFLKETDKATFFEKYGLSLHKKTICFSGDDTITSPHDPQYLEDLAASIAYNNTANDYQIIFRRCPVDLSDRYDAVLQKYKHIITPIAPKWSNTQKQWSQLYPFTDDVALLANISKYSDVVINLGSTMALDFTYFKKPAIYLNYDPVEDEKWSVKTIYNFQHFRSMPSKKAVYWVHHKNKILEVLQTAINHKMPKEAEQWFSIINVRETSVAKNIVNVLTTTN